MAELIAAAQRANLSVVRRLLKRGADARARDFSNGETALHAVCAANANQTSERTRVAVVQELLNSGAQPNVRGRYDWTPLHYACWRNHPEIVALLLRAGADPEARTARRTPSSMPSGIASTSGDTARDQAQKAGHTACVMAIDAYQAEVHYGLSHTDCGELGPGGGGKFKRAGTGALPSGSRHLSADDLDAGGRVQYVGHSRPCLDEAHLHPAPAWGGLGDSVGSLLGGETNQVQVARAAEQFRGREGTQFINDEAFATTDRTGWGKSISTASEVTKGDTIEVRDGPASKEWYPAIVLTVSAKDGVTVHYPGWKTGGKDGWKGWGGPPETPTLVPHETILPKTMRLRRRKPEIGFVASGISTSQPHAVGAAGQAQSQSMYGETNETTLRANFPNSWRRPARETLPDCRGVAAGYAAHAAEGSHLQGDPSAPWVAPRAGATHEDLIPHGQSLDEAASAEHEVSSTGAGWNTAYSALPPGARVVSSEAARRAEPNCGNRMLHPRTAYLKLKPTTALTTLHPDVYDTAGRLMGEQPVTAKPGHLPRDTMLPSDNAKLKLPKDPERFAKHRPEDTKRFGGYAFDYESGQQHLSKDWRPAFKDDGVTAVKGTGRWTTDFPGKHYTHTGAAKGATNTYHVPGAHYAWPAFEDVKKNLIYQQGTVGPRRPVNEPAHGGL